MSSNGERQNQDRNATWLAIEILVKSDRSELLRGLDLWLQLNLISEAQVKDICRRHLSCSLPKIQATKALPSVRQTEPIASSESSAEVASKPNAIVHLWQSFLDELSIRWLLFLGIFLVVVSSGVLAASQWDNFPGFGQYLILLIYTLSFWFVGYVASKQDNLKLTSQTLGATATLLIPINFWAIDQFSLGNNLLEWLTVAIAAIALTACGYLRFRLVNANKYFLPFYLLLSYLHLAWQIDFIPFIAIYGGIIGISSIHYFKLLERRQYPLAKVLFLFVAWLLLLLRCLLDREILIINYLLSIALSGWLLATIYLTRERQAKIIVIDEEGQIFNAFLSKVFQIISIVILFVTWLLSLLAGIFESSLFFWQTIGIGALAIHLFSQRLTLYWRKRDLTAIFLIGLHTLYISKELIPPVIRTNALDLAIKISQTEYFPESVFGVTLFPYVILFVAIATWLYRRQKKELALYAEVLTLLLALFLTYLSYANPLWRSLNLLFSTITLAYVGSIRQPLRRSLIYLAHLLGLATIINAVFVIFPNLSPTVWGNVFTLLTVIEWKIYLDLVKQPRIKYHSNYSNLLKHSCWYFGLLLGTVSYVCYLAGGSYWVLIWSIVPGMLTLIARRTRKIQQRRMATLLSCTTLVAAQLLVIEQPIARFISLALAIGLMFANAFNLRRLEITAIHIGFGLSLIASLLYGYVIGWNWLILGAVAILGLYRFRQYLQRFVNLPRFSYISQRVGYGIFGVGTEPINKKLVEKYIQAADYWAIFLIAVKIAVLSIVYLNLRELQVYGWYLLTTVLLAVALVWRYRQDPNNLVLYSFVWLIELFVAGAIVSTGGNSLALAIANIILGLLSLAFVRRLAATSPTWGRLNLAYISLVYAVLGMLLRLSYFNAYTGLLTLGTALILIEITFNQPKTNLATKYIAFAAISLGIYELVIYQMQLSSGGSAADGLTILALVAAAIAFTYRLGAWWYRQRQHRKIFGLNLSQVIFIGHIHWAISSILKILAAGIAIEGNIPRLTPISIATSFCLGAYALVQGRDSEPEATKPNTANDWWVYVGLVEIAATVVYSRLIITKLSLFDPLRVIFTCIVALAIYQIPWRNLGWRATPWQRTALILPALMALVTAEDISYFSLFASAVFYLRIAYYQKNLRWSYVSLGFLNWGIIRLVWQYNLESIWLAAIFSLSILYIARFDPYLKSHRQQRHYVRLLGCSILCVNALLYQNLGIIPSLIGFGLIFAGLGLKIRAFLFAGTITLLFTASYQLIILILTYSFLKWIVGSIAGICLIVIAASFEKQRQHFSDRLQTYTERLHNWQ